MTIYLFGRGVFLPALHLLVLAVLVAVAEHHVVGARGAAVVVAVVRRARVEVLRGSEPPASALSGRRRSGRTPGHLAHVLLVTLRLQNCKKEQEKF